MLWYTDRFPIEYEHLLTTLKQSHKNSRDLAVEMYAHVHGQRDASREWGKHIDAVIMDKPLCLTPNWANSCIYQGMVKQSMVFIARATDDRLIATPSPDAYKYVVSILCSHWKVHDMELVEHYFGLQFIHSPSWLSIDQNHLIKEALTYVFGPSWPLQKSETPDIVPMLPGISHEEALDVYHLIWMNLLLHCCATVRLPIPDLTWSIPTLLYLKWTRLDIQTATQRLAQHQNAPGSLYFEGLLQISTCTSRHASTIW